MSYKEVLNPIFWEIPHWTCPECWGEGCVRCRGLGIIEFGRWEGLWFWAMSYFATVWFISTIVTVLVLMGVL